MSLYLVAIVGHHGAVSLCCCRVGTLKSRHAAETAKVKTNAVGHNRRAAGGENPDDEIRDMVTFTRGSSWGR